MPIYEYRCDKCGLEKEYLQKLGAAPITACPCGESTMTKLISAAGFQLKGSGWYATDFKNGGKSPAAKKSDGDSGEAKSGESAKEAESKGADSKGAESKGSEAKATEPATKGATAGATTNGPAAA
jgi:putative FmdB family regulatory protein